MSVATDTVLGIQRESLLNNPLLMKSELGKPLKRCFNLPPDGFTYGQRSLGKDVGAADALAAWKTIPPPRQLQRDKRVRRDFIAMNKAATQAGLVTAQEHFQYRATHDLERVASPNSNTLKATKRLPPTMVFGVPTQRTQTPVFDLLEHKYQDKWLQERRHAELSKRSKEEKKNRSGSSKGYYETRASMLRRHSPPVYPPPLWQMAKFRTMPGQLETFRSQKARQMAFSHHASDCTSRTGVFGHGIYEEAQS